MRSSHVADDFKKERKSDENEMKEAMISALT